MRTLLEEIVAALLFGVAIPGTLLSGLVWLQEHPLREPEPVVMAAEETQPEAISVTVLHRLEDGTLAEEALEHYLVGVVLAEMPALFEEEALKAQAVVARTYARKVWQTGGKHKDGSVCVDPSCCQGWRSPEGYLAEGGTEDDLEKVRRAVNTTSGQVLTYGDELIEATYFSCSGGRTEDAAAVWGQSFPYLKAVDSPGEEHAAHASAGGGQHNPLAPSGAA